MEEPYSRLIASKAHSAGHITRVADEPSPCPTGRLEVSEAVGWVTREQKGKRRKNDSGMLVGGDWLH